MTAIVLVAHGSPDPDWRLQTEAVRDAVRAASPERVVEVAYLAPSAPTLHDVVEHLERRGIRRAQVLALFLSPGGRHVKSDLPALVSDAARPDLELVLIGGALGSEPEVIDALARAAVRLSNG